MKVKVKLYGDYLRYGADENLLEVEENSSVNDLLNKLQISERHYIIVLVNMKRVWFEEKLKDNDTVSIFSPVGGG